MNQKNIQEQQIIADLEQLALKYRCNLAYIHTITAPSSSKKRGRPKGSGIDDTALLVRMQELLTTGKCKSIHAAALEVAYQIKVHSIESTSRRLTGKYKKYMSAITVPIRGDVRVELRVEQVITTLNAMSLIVDAFANMPLIKLINAFANTPLIKLIGKMSSTLSNDVGLLKFAKVAGQFTAPLSLLPDLSRLNVLGSFAQNYPWKIEDRTL